VGAVVLWGADLSALSCHVMHAMSHDIICRRLCMRRPAVARWGESKRLVVESPWSQFTSECQRC
jgi:hypothetical protein